MDEEFLMDHRVISDPFAHAIHIVDRDLKITWINEAYINLLNRIGLNSDIVGLTVREASPFLPEAIFDEYQAALAGELVITSETTSFSNGLNVDTETHKIPVVIGGEVVAVITVIRDLTEQNRRLKSLKQSERLFRRFMETVDLIAVSLDVSGDITFINDYTLSLCGWERDEVLGKNWFELFLPSDEIKLTVEAYHEALMGNGEGATPHFENRIVTKNGKLLDISWNNTVLRDIEGNIIGSASIGEDVTERNRMDRELRDFNEKLKEYSHEISHDLRRPLRTAINRINLLKEDFSLLSEEERIQTLDLILVVLDTGRRLINELLSQAEAVGRDAELVPLDPNPIIDEVLELLDAREMELNREPDMPIFLGNELLVRQVFMNLIDNALKFNPSDSKTVSITHYFTEKGMLVDVADNGPGISPELEDKLFEPYVKFGDQAGSGVGLSIVKRSMERMGGEVTFTSSPEKGTTFHLTFKIP